VRAACRIGAHRRVAWVASFSSYASRKAVTWRWLFHAVGRGYEKQPLREGRATELPAGHARGLGAFSPVRPLSPSSARRRTCRTEPACHSQVGCGTRGIR